MYKFSKTDLKSVAKTIDDNFHDAIIQLRESGDIALSETLEDLQNRSHSLLNDYLDGEHPNNKYYDSDSKQTQARRSNRRLYGV